MVRAALRRRARAARCTVVISGVTVTGSEYSTGMVTTSLTTVPRRGRLCAAKTAAGLCNQNAYGAGKTTTIRMLFGGHQAGYRGDELTQPGLPLRAELARLPGHRADNRDDGTAGSLTGCAGCAGPGIIGHGR